MQALNIQPGLKEVEPQPVQVTGHGRVGADQGESSFDKLLQQLLAEVTEGAPETQADFPQEVLVSALDGAHIALEGETGELFLSELVAGREQSDAGEKTADLAHSLTQKEIIPDEAVQTVAEQKSGTEVFDLRREKKAKNTGAKNTSEEIFAAAPRPEAQVQTEASESHFEKAAGAAAQNAVLPEIPVITIDDRRTSPQKESGLSTAVVIDKNGEAQMTLTLSAQTPQHSGVNADGLPVKNAQNFSHMLSQEIQGNASEFVKTGSIILRDNNAGTINMVLHPEELGNVKIKLELSDKVITGKITVESLDAFNAFKSNLQTLRAAFTENGFSSAGFELSWNGSDAQTSGGGNGRQGGGEKNPHGRFYSESMPAVLSETGEKTGTYGFSAINVMA